MEQANTDRPKARSTRKGKPPETSSEDSYNADRGKAHTQVSGHWQSTARCTVPHWTIPTGFHRAAPGAVANTRNKGGAGVTAE